MAQYANEAEVVYEVTGTIEEQKEILKHNKQAKLLRAARREEERFAAPSIYTRFKNGIKNLFGLAKAKETQQQQQQQNQQNVR